MRWKLIRRRLSISAPRVIIRSHLPWPLRWAVVALVFGFSASLALWAFQVGGDLAGLDTKHVRAELARLREEVAQLREDRDKAQAVANTAESLLTTERAAEGRLADQLRQSEAEKLQMRADLGFFERLLPAAGGQDGLTVRGFEASAEGPGHLRYQVLLLQAGKSGPVFNGKYQVLLGGTLDGQPWSLTAPRGAQALAVKQYARVEGVVDYPAQAMVKTIELRVTDVGGTVRAMQTLRL